mgnify:CR=1 FL=1
MTTRRQFLTAGLLAVVAAGGFERLAAQGLLPPKSPVGLAGAANGRHSGGLPSFFEALRARPVAYVEYCRSLGAGGIQAGIATDLAAVRKRLDELGMYYEGNAALPRTLDESTDAFEQSLTNAKALGATLVRTVSRPPQGTSGRRYEGFTSRQQYVDWLQTANAIVEKCLPIAERHGIVIALENHKDRSVDEHVAFLQRISSPYLGSLIDPGNNMSFMERPEETVGKLAPFVKATSLKDMGVAPYEDGFLLSEVRFGTGMTDQKALFELMRSHNPKLNAMAELITRDPLKVPVLTDDYYRSFPDGYRARVDGWLAMVRERASLLPYPSQLSSSEQLLLEETNNRDTFAWGLANLS